MFAKEEGGIMMRYHVKVILLILSLFFLHSCISSDKNENISEELKKGDSYSIVKLNLEELKNNSEISKAEAKNLYITLPDGKIIFLEKKKIEKRETGFSWFGKVKGVEDSSVLITVENGVATGSIRINKNLYKILPFSVKEDLYKIEDLSGKKAVPFHNDTIPIPVREKTNKESAKQIKKQVALEDGSRIDVLFLYTQAFEDKFKGRSGAISEIRRLVDITNTAFSNSGINTRINPVGFVKFTDSNVDESVYITNALNYIKSNQEVDNLRKTYKADLVSLLREYRGNNYCGYAYIPVNLPTDIENHVSDYVTYDKNFGFSVVEDGIYGNRYCFDTTLAHELGHNFGCEHDRDHTTGKGAFPYSYGYDIPGVFATIMSYDRPIIEYFSTPNITYQGYPIGKPEGDPEAADNVKTINKTSILIANYINKNENIQTPPYLYIDSPSIDFGNVKIGNTSVRTLTISNTGTQNLNISSVSISPNSEFYINDYCTGKSLSINATCNIEVVFSPTSAGNKSATLTIKSNASNKPTLNIPVKGQGLDPNVPNISVFPNSVNFGEVEIGKIETKEIYIRNTGEGSLLIYSVDLTGGSEFFIREDCTDRNITPGSVCSIQITFSPNSEGNKTATITIHSNANNFPTLNIPVSGIGKKTQAPIIEVTPTEIDFGTIFRKQALTKTIVIKNTSNEKNIDLYLNIPLSEDFTLTHDCPPTLNSQASCIITVTFQPKTVGEKKYKFTIETNDPNNRRISINLHGKAIPLPAYIEVNPRNINFGEIYVGETVKKSIIIRNIGDKTLDIKSITSTSSEFQILRTCRSIEPQGSCELIVEFKPITAGDKEALLTIYSNAENKDKVVVSLSGKAIEKKEPRIVIPTKTLDFGSVIEGQTVTKKFTIENIGNADLHLNNSVRGEGYSIVSNCKVIKPGRSCNLVLSFTPPLLGIIEGRLVISSDDPKNKEIVVVLKGKGIKKPTPFIDVYPKKIDFGQQFIGTVTQKSITVENKGNADLLIKEISITDTKNFIIANSCSKVEPGDRCTISIKFRPQETGNIRGVLNIISNDGRHPTIEIPLLGFGKEIPKPKLYVDRKNLDFGEIFVGNSKELYITVKNTGSADLQISSITLLKDDGIFSVNTDCSTLKSNETCKITISFKPTKDGEITNTLLIKSNVSDIYIKLSGKGVKRKPKIVISSKTVNFGEVFLGKTEERNLTIENSGTENLEIYSISIEGSKRFSIKEIKKQSQCKTLRPGERCKITITYKPEEETQDIGFLVIKTNDPINPEIKVSLLGYGVKQPQPDIYISQKSLDFGAIEIGKKSKIKEIIIKNKGNAPLIIESMVFPKNNFIVISGCSSLSSNESCTIKVVFTPTKIGKITDFLEIISNDPDQPKIRILLSGIGKKPSSPDIFISRKYLAFGTVFIGESRKIPIYIRNKGTAPLDIKEITITGDNDFYIKNNCLKTLEPKEECSISIRFTPSSEGKKTGLLKIVNNDPDENVLQVKILGIGKKFKTKEFDIDNDGDISIRDILSLTEVVLKEEKEPKADLNKDGEVDIADIILLIKALKFKGEGR